MKLLTRLLLVFLMVTFCNLTQAQWMKKTESSDDLYKMAKRDIDLKRYQRAINECNQGLESSPKNFDIRLLLGRAYALAGKMDSARTELNYVRERNPRYRDVYIYLVNLEATACNYDQALEYADEGLKYFPNDRELLLKKMDLYNRKGDWAESDKMAAYLFEHYNTDPYIRSIYIEYKLSIARHYYTAGYIDIALRAYNAVLEQEPLNKEAMDAIYNLDVRSGNYGSSLIAINRALLTNPNSYELYMKKLSILLAMSNYTDAIGLLEMLQKLYPGNGEVSRVLTATRMDAGRYYMKQDALVQFEMVLEKEPDNVDALNYVINISYSRGQLPEALQFVNLALRRSPNNKELLGKKLGILETMENYGQAAAIAEQLYKENPSPAGKEHMLELRNISARNYMADLEYDSALVCYNSILAYDRSNMQAINGLVSIYAQQKKYDDALHTIDEALKLYPDNEQLLYRKAGVLDAYTHYTEAAQISKKLIEKHPKNKYYIAAFVEQTLSASRLSMQMEDYVITVHILKQALDMQPDNLDALNYIINLELSLKQYDSALYYVNEGIHYYPDSKDFVFKKALVYAEAKQFKAAYAISGGLYNAYPYNNRFKSAYVDHLLGSGRQFMNNDQPDSALVEFNKALAISPNDTVTLFYTINLLNDGKQFDEALALIEQGRQLYPTHPYFLLKRAVVLESQKQYEAAYRAMDTLSKAGQMDQKYIDYKELLYSKQLRNELGLLYLNSTFDPTTIVGDNSIRRIATIQYSHRFDNGSVTTRINYAGRITGSGYQVELEGTLNHSAKWYSWATSGVSNPNSIFPNTNLVFPPLRLGYSLFHALPKGYDLELGIRFVKLDSDKTYSGVFGLSKEWKDFYFTGHLYETQLNHLGITAGPYPSYSLSTKYFVKDDHTSFITALIGYGSAPDDISRILQIGYKTILYKTISVGAGYTMQLHYRTTLGINYSWFNIQYHASTGPGDLDGYKNQYDLFLVLSHKF